MRSSAPRSGHPECGVVACDEILLIRGMVEGDGFEPSTARLSARYSNQTELPLYGQDERNRTFNPLLPKQVLYQVELHPDCRASYHDMRKAASP